MSTRLAQRILILLATSLVLGACNRMENFADLEAFVQEVKARPGAEVEPVPEFIPYQGFIYSAASLRSPFDVPVAVIASDGSPLDQNVVPDFEREREALEEQPLSELTMVGWVTRSGNYEAIIEDQIGIMHRVRVGNYLGRNFGRIVAISDTQINLTEIVPSGSGGWIERPQILTLQ